MTAKPKPAPRPSVRKLRRGLVTGTDRERERVKDELHQLATSDIADVMAWDDGKLVLKDFDLIPAGARRCIKKIRVVSNNHGMQLEVELHDKLSALRILARHYGLLETGLMHSSKPSVVGINLRGPVLIDEEDGRN